MFNDCNFYSDEEKNTLSISFGFDKVVVLAREQMGSNGRSH